MGAGAELLNVASVGDMESQNVDYAVDERMQESFAVESWPFTSPSGRVPVDSKDSKNSIGYGVDHLVEDDDIQLMKKGELDPEMAGALQVILTVPTTDDPHLPVSTFRVWLVGSLACILYTFIDTFFAYRAAPLHLSTVLVQLISLPLGKFLARTLPTTVFRIPVLNWGFTMNPGLFNKKEHVLTTVLAARASGGSGATRLVLYILVFYKRKITFFPSLFLVISTHLIGYGFAGILREALVTPASMWWPDQVASVAFFGCLHPYTLDITNQKSKNGRRRHMPGVQFFFICAVLMFFYYPLPGYFFPMLTTVSVVCLFASNSITAQQIGSGIGGLGIGAFTFDWATMKAFLGNPLIDPKYTIINMGIGIILCLYVTTPLLYWNDVYNAKTFPLFSTKLYTQQGAVYNTSKIINARFELDVDAYDKYGGVHMAATFAQHYAAAFAVLGATISHTVVYYSRDLWRMTRARNSASAGKDETERILNVHTRLMKAYPDVPPSWFLILIAGTIFLSITTVTWQKHVFQLPWWGILLSLVTGFVFILPIGLIKATTNQQPGVTILFAYIGGYIWPGLPSANMVFDIFSGHTIGGAMHVLAEFKLCTYMKIPPRSMFLVQVIGSIMAGIVNLGTAWWLIHSVPNFCHPELLPDSSPWTCPSENVGFSSSIIWGTLGTRRVFGQMGYYSTLNWAFVIGLLLPIPIWLVHKKFPEKKWISLINVPIILGPFTKIPPAHASNCIPWLFVGLFSSHYVFKYHQGWWTRYNYLLSSALDTGIVFAGMAIYAMFNTKRAVDWWGTQGQDHCPLSKCPTAPGIVLKGCPVF